VWTADSDGKVSAVEIIGGRITHFYAMRNPDKLAGIDIPREISR
jgi:RNA polymerase sigma-70 factor (ECF subfamily)